jgi:radical SAM superfamily enzyme YgiQ (UPF0313 family)
MAVKAVLVYPFFRPANDNSIFRFPPLGLGYIAAALKSHNIEGKLVDCTFLNLDQAIKLIVEGQPQIVGFYCMFSMKKSALELAEACRSQLGGGCLFVVGGPLPSWSPESFLSAFDVVVVGRGSRLWLSWLNPSCMEERRYPA